MEKARTTQEGYYFLKKADKWLHFSMNCWINLKQFSGKDVGTWGAEYDKGDELDKFIALCEVAYAAMLAYDQEERNEVDYEIYDVRLWMEGLDEDEAAQFLYAMGRSLSMPEAGKKKAKK